MSNNKYKLLICEDDHAITVVLRTLFESNGYQVMCTDSCNGGYNMYVSHLPDLVILDLGLPDTDGMEFITKVREISAVPILVLSARTEEKEKVKAFDLGANDYITKPFGTAELVARVKAALRTATLSAGNIPGKKFILNGMSIDYDRRHVVIDGSEIRLTQTEYNILAYLSRHSGKVLTYAAIINEIWGRADLNGIKKLQVNMANLRKKMGVRPGDNRFIINELGVGYRMQDQME